MANLREQRIQSALQDIQDGVSLRSASRRWNIPRATLSDRMHGAETRRESQISCQRLSPLQESFVADSAINEESAGRAPSRRLLTAFAEAVLAGGGDHRPLGARWVDRFLRRNPTVKTKNSVLLDSARTRGSTRINYEVFFQRLREQLDSKNIKPAIIANIDEYGMQELEIRAGTVIGSSLTRRAIVTASDDTTWVSVIECGTAEGKRLSPVVIFTGASLQGQWFPHNFRFEEELPSWRYKYSATGWSNNEIAIDWFKHVYLLETKPANASDWRLLILDEHSTHITKEIMVMAHRNRVQLLYLPAHTTHKTQPLDRSVFSALKNYFRQNTRVFGTAVASAPVNKQRFLYCYRDAARRGMSARNIISGFRETGIWPYDASKILNDPEAIVEERRPPEQPSTPTKRQPHAENSIIRTPQQSQDIRRAVDLARQHVSPTSRSVRAPVAKIGDVLDKKNADIAALREALRTARRDLEAQKPRTKTRVKENPNDSFARVEDITAAQEASERPPKRRKGGRQNNPEPVVEQAQEMIVHGLDRLRQAEEI